MVRIRNTMVGSGFIFIKIIIIIIITKSLHEFNSIESNYLTYKRVENGLFGPI
ncbi:MAG: hypothetical protein N7Q72_01905 [Spiroplasma sp. Tabriz.8]|nr:hypothetical protein [Spiroplasma sp. Tabriz.8]